MNIQTSYMSDNTKNSNRIIKNTSLLYFRQIFTLFISLYTASLTLRVLGEVNYGIYAAIGGFTSLISIITNSLTTGTQRFITYELGRGDLERLNKVYCTSINIHIFLAIILLIFGEIIGTWFIFHEMEIPPERTMTAFIILQFTLFNSALSLINTPNSAEIVAHEDIGAWSIVSIIDTILKLVAVAILYFITWDKLISYAAFLFIIQFLNRTICVMWCKRKYPEVTYKFIWDKELFKSILKISGWSSLPKLAQTGFVQGNSIILNIYFGPIVNAAYAIALQAFTGIKQFSNNFQIASMPQIVKSYSIGDIDRTRKLLFSVSKMSFYMIYLISLPFILNAKTVLVFWLKDVPEHTTNIFILLLIYAFTDIFSTPLDIVAQAVGKLKKYSLCVSLCIISTLLFSIIAIQYIAIPEIIFIIAITISWLCIFIRLSCLKQIIEINIKDFCANVLVSCAIVVIISLLPLVLLNKTYDTDNLFFLIIKFLFSFLFVASTIYFVGLNKQEKIQINGFIKKMLIKIKF